MIAVAMLAIALGGWQTIERRRIEFRRRIDEHTEANRPYRRYGAVIGHENATCAEYQAKEWSILRPLRDGTGTLLAAS